MEEFMTLDKRIPLIDRLKHRCEELALHTVSVDKAIASLESNPEVASVLDAIDSVGL